ncbi:MAG: amidohydrolase family protein [Candidatus Bathyarchaeota archaeon]|nr:amidohydrolase family protein [Candidatus Bathyarchaeota archaeon]
MKVLRCEKAILGNGGAIEDAVLLIEGSKIMEVGDKSSVDIPRDAEEVGIRGGFVLPGLIDTHLHLAIGPGENYAEQFRSSDGVHLATGVVNARVTLDSGVTTARDLGARNRVAFDLREVERTGLILSPRLLVCGRSITMTGGHFHYCGAEADGYEGVRKATRQLLKEGADFIKIMTSGGGTVGTRRELPSYSTEEIRGAVDAAHSVGKTVTAHCHATQAIINAVEAGVDVIEHCSFMGPDGRGGVKHEFREDVAEEVVKKGIWVDNLLNPRQENYGRVKNSFENFRGFKELNAKILPGTDGLKPLQTGLMPLALEMWVKGGASPMEAMMAATSISAEAIGLGDLIGTIEPGKEADLVVVGSDPLMNIVALRDPQMIMKGGKVVPPSMQFEARGELARLASGFSAAFT